MSLPFLLEIGTEEIPDWMITRSLVQLKELFEGRMLQNDLSYHNPMIDATPRRLVLRTEGIQDRKDDKWEIVKGPPKDIAFKGNALTKAGIAFAKRCNATQDDLFVQATDKGDYIAYRMVIPGRETHDILAEALPDIILGIHFPKTMYWTAKTGPR